MKKKYLKPSASNYGNYPFFLVLEKGQNGNANVALHPYTKNVDKNELETKNSKHVICVSGTIMPFRDR